MYITAGLESVRSGCACVLFLLGNVPVYTVAGVQDGQAHKSPVGSKCVTSNKQILTQWSY